MLPEDELPPAPPMFEDELEDELDELGPDQPLSPPSPPLPGPFGALPVAQAAAAKIPNNVTVISTSRAFIVLPHA